MGIVSSVFRAEAIGVLSLCNGPTSPPFPLQLHPRVHVGDIVHFCAIVIHTVHNFSPPSPNPSKFGFFPQFGGF